MFEKMGKIMEERTSFSPFVFALALVLAIICTVQHGISDWQVSAFFSIPFFQFVILWRVGKKEKEHAPGTETGPINYVLNCLTLILSMSVAPYMVFWLLYSTGSYRHLPKPFYIPLFFVVGLMIGTVYFIHILMDGAPSGRCKWLKEKMQNHSFLTISFFFGSFLSVVYLLSFAFAFEDRVQRLENDRRIGAGKVGLHVNAEIAARKDVFREMASDIDNANPNRRIVVPLASHQDRQIHSLILFEKNASEVHFNFNLAEEYDASNNIEYIEGFNARRLTHVRDGISELVRREVEEAPNAIRLAVSLIGHTSEPSPSGNPFVSNYELSDARVRQVQRILLWCLVNNPEPMPLPMIEWHLVPISREDNFLEETDELREKVQKTFADPARSVEIAIYVIDDDFAWQHSKYLARRSVERRREEDSSFDQLTLLDYVYFTVYTVTTTGYGDIVPVSKFSIFVATLANIIELFYIVVFFNVLVSTSRPPPGSGKVNGDVSPLIG